MAPPAVCSVSTRPSIRVTCAALKIGQQLCFAGLDEVDQGLIERFTLRVRLTLSDGGLGQLGVTSAFDTQAAEPGGSVVSTFCAITESISPPTATGCAAPVRVLGAIAATSPASSRKNPRRLRAPRSELHRWPLERATRGSPGWSSPSHPSARQACSGGRVPEQRFPV